MDASSSLPLALGQPGLDQTMGGIPVPAISLFMHGMAQMFWFSSLDTYCIDVLPEPREVVIAGSYTVR